MTAPVFEDVEKIRRGHILNRLVDYEFFKARFVRENPNATPEQYERAIRDIAKRLGL